MNFKEMINMISKHDYVFEDKYEDIPNEIVNIIKELIILDTDYKLNSKKQSKKSFILPWNLITNKKWEGYWKKSTGNDALKFIKYLQESEYDNKNIINKFHVEWETDDTPYCISMAEEMRKKYINI